MEDELRCVDRVKDYLLCVADKSKPLFALTAQIISGSKTIISGHVTYNQIKDRYEIIEQPRFQDPGLKVSVIIPTFNRPDLLVYAVESVFAQISVSCEIIIVNDRGQEIPGHILRRFRQQRYPVTVAQHTRNLGLGASRNTGASLAKGKWIMMLDDDDVLVGGSIKELVHVASSESGSKFIFGNHLRQFYEGGTAKHVEYRRVDRYPMTELCIENPIMCGSFIIDSEVFAFLGGYREDLPVHEDYNFHIRILSSLRTAYVDKPICVYHCRECIPRLNHQRLYWFATSAFNHAVFRSLFHKTGDSNVKTLQRENQYAHMARCINEGCSVDFARSLVHCWWEVLASYGLREEIGLDQAVIPAICPAILD